MTKRYVFAIDPGGTTGFAIIERETLACVELEEIHGHKDAARYVAQKLQEYKDDVEVVIEAFRISAQTGKNSGGSAALAIEFIGMVRLLCWQYGADEPPQQTSADAQAFLDNKHLQALGWWKRGSKDHCRMAAKHAGLYLLRTGCRLPALLDNAAFKDAD